MGRRPVDSDVCGIERTHGGAATPKRLEGDRPVLCNAADTKQFAQIGNTSFTSGRPVPVASTVVSVERLKGGEPTMTFSNWLEFAKANWRKEEGQTMAEYGVVLAVITVGIVLTLGLLSGGIRGALSSVISYL
jgi:Flp pilus assembly pilin Flp